MPTWGRRRVMLPAALIAAILAATACTGDGPKPGELPGVDGEALPTKAPSGAPAAPMDGRSEPAADPVYPEYGNPKIDVLHYQLALNYTPASKRLRGTATLSIRPVVDGSEIVLDLARTLKVDKVTVDGTVARSAQRADDLVITAPRPVVADDEISVVVTYHGIPKPVPFPGGRMDVSSIGVDTAPNGALWAQQEPYGAFTWYPCSDQPSDEALYDFAITTPAGWVGVANGTYRGESGSGATRTHTWHAEEPIASYLVAFAVDEFKRHEQTGPRGLPISYWVHDRDWGRVRSWLEQSPEMLDWLERLVGPYPFSTAGVVIPPMTSGMETQTMITMGPMAATDAPPVLLHEYSHHWFGDAVTPRTWRDIWLNEGPATYLQMVYTVDVRGGRQGEIIDRWRQEDKRQRRDAGPPGNYRPNRFADGNVYIGPALMLHEIRGVLGDASFFAMLHDWVQHHRHTTQDRASFTTWVNAYTGRNLSPIIDKWLDSPTTPS